MFGHNILGEETTWEIIGVDGKIILKWIGFEVLTSVGT
jgi:hypothetical protein